MPQFAVPDGCSSAGITGKVSRDKCRFFRPHDPLMTGLADSGTFRSTGVNACRLRRQMRRLAAGSWLCPDNASATPATLSRSVQFAGLECGGSPGLQPGDAPLVLSRHRLRIAYRGYFSKSDAQAAGTDASVPGFGNQRLWRACLPTLGYLNRLGGYPRFSTFTLDWQEGDFQGLLFHESGPSGCRM